jgi:hypothetical protein
MLEKEGPLYFLFNSTTLLFVVSLRYHPSHRIVCLIQPSCCFLAVYLRKNKHVRESYIFCLI